MTDSEARKVADAILAALDEECARNVAQEHRSTEVWANAAPEDQEMARCNFEFARGQQVGSYWAHDVARRAYHDYFGEWPPNPGNQPLAR